MRRWLIDALSPTSRRSVAKWFPSVRQSFSDGFTNVMNLSAHDSVISQQVREELKVVHKSLRKRDLLPIQGLNQYCLRLLLISCLYTVMAIIAVFWFTLCRRSNCYCQVDLQRNDLIKKGILFVCLISFDWESIDSKSPTSHLSVASSHRSFTD